MRWRNHDWDSPVTGRFVLPRILWVALLYAVVGALEGFSVLTIIPLFRAIGRSDLGEVDPISGRIASMLPFEPTFVHLAALIVGLVLLKSLLQIGGYAYARWLQIEVELRAKASLTRAVLESDLRFLNRADFGLIANLTINETRSVGIIVNLLSRLLDKGVRTAIYVVILLLVSWKLSALTIASGGLLYFVLRPAHRFSRRNGMRIAELNGRLQGLLGSTLNGFRSMKALVAEQTIQDRLSHLLRTYQRRQVSLAGVEAVTQAVFDPVVVVIALFAVVTFTDVSLVAFGVFLVALSRAYTSLRALQSVSFKLSNRGASYSLYRRTMTELREHRSPMTNVGRVFETLGDGLRFEDVLFRYEGPDRGEFTLGPLNLHIARGSIVALVGESGSGKSTCVDLMVGLIPPSGGQITICGRPLEEYDVSSYRRRIGYVTQENFLLSASAAENIAFPEAADRERVEGAARLAHADTFIRELPEGYDTMLGENASRLSGGQRQRVCLARALYREPELLILDEATSALDPEAERRILEVIDGLRSRMAIVHITHRLATVESADEVYMLQRGSVVGHGTYADLRNRNVAFIALQGRSGSAG